jgi:hypothetical protein
VITICDEGVADKIDEEDTDGHHDLAHGGNDSAIVVVAYLTEQHWNHYADDSRSNTMAASTNEEANHVSRRNKACSNEENTRGHE